MLILISSVVGFTNCPSDNEFEDAIRSAIVNYFRTHSEEDLNVLKDLIEFYSTNDLSTADCSEVGKNSGVEIQEAYKDTGNVSEVVEGVDEKSTSLIEEVFSWVDDLLHSEWISNNIIGITLHSWGSDDFQFPIGSNNLWRSGGMRFAVRYNNNLKWSHDGWIGSGIQTLPVTEDLDFVENTADKKVAVGKVADNSIEVKTEATLLKDKKWMLIKYTLRNKGSSAISNVKFYHGADFDVDHVTYSNDYGGYDSTLKLLYEYDYDGKPYVGFASSLNPAKYDVSQYQQIWSRINSDSLAMGNSYGMGDVGVAFRWDFGTLYPGETKEIPIVLGAGASLSNLKNEINNGLGYISPVQEPKLKILAVPIRWTRSNDEFKTAFNEALDVFLRQLELNNCRDKVYVEWVDVSQGLNDFHCCYTPQCIKDKNTCQVNQVMYYVMANLKKNPKDFNIVAGLVDENSFEKTGCNRDPRIDGCHHSYGNVVWANENYIGYKHVMAHEIGHIFGLEDEYCSNQAGSTDCKCNDGGSSLWQQYCLLELSGPDPNPLGSTLGCDPTGALDPDTGFPCCNFDNDHLCSNVNYGVCCYGNKNAYGGRDIMSYTSASEPRWFDVHSVAHLNTKTELRCN